MKKLLALPAYMWIVPVIMLPRVVAHDLHLVVIDSPAYTAMAVAPLVVWLVVAACRRTKQPLREQLLLGLVYGLLLALAHQLTWVTSFGDHQQHIGGNLTGKLDPVTEAVILRTFAFISSALTGVVTGAIFGAVALAANRLRGRG